MDPTGTDEITVYRQIAPGADHEAKYVGNDKTGWTYVSKDGAATSSTFGFSGPSAVTIAHVDNAADVAKDAAGRGYTSGFFHTESSQQDSKNITATEAAAKTDYNLATANCGQTAQAGDKAAGVPHDGDKNVNPRDDHNYMQSKQGAKDGWSPVKVPTPPPPPDPKDKNR